MPILLEGIGQTSGKDTSRNKQSTSAIKLKDSGRKEVDLPAWLEPLLRHDVMS